MRTKTTILTAAVIAAGALSSMAQNNVYSLNVVGYINVPLPTGYNLIANQLVGSDQTIPTVLGTNYVNGCTVFKWNPSAQGFAAADSYYDLIHTGGAAPAGWYDQNLNPSSTTLNPGEAFFFYNPGVSNNVTLVGQVTQGTNSVSAVAGYSFLSIIPPLSVDLSTNGPLVLLQSNGNIYFTFNNAAGNYGAAVSYYDLIHTGGAAPAGWYDASLNPAVLQPAVGQGFVFFNSSTTTPWVNTFSVQ